MMKFPLTLRSLLERAARLFPNVEIVSSRPDNSIHRSTYGEMCRRAGSLAAVLQAAGLKQGDRVASLMWNHYVHLEAYFGVPCAGGVLHTLNLRLHPDELAYIINHAQDRFLIVDDVLLHLFEGFKNKVNFERVFVVPFSGAIRARGVSKTTKRCCVTTARLPFFRTSTKTTLPPCVIPRARREGRKVWPIHTGRSPFIPIPFRCRIIFPSPDSTASCRQCPCFMPMPGDCRMLLS